MEPQKSEKSKPEFSPVEIQKRGDLGPGILGRKVVKTNTVFKILDCKKTKFFLELKRMKILGMCLEFWDEMWLSQ